MANLSKRQFIILATSGILFLIFAFLVFSNIRKPGTGSEQVALMVWGLEDKKIFDGVIAGYKVLRPNVEVKYEQVLAANYDDELLRAIAAGRGPDVFYVPNTGIPRLKDIIAPVGAGQFGIARLRELFPQVVEQDFLLDGRIYALPLYIDTLAFIYNRDFFDSAGIASPPAIWAEFQRTIALLRKFGEGGKITRAAAAIGGSEASVDAGVDLLNLLMLQNGAKIAEEGSGLAVFASGDSGTAGFNAFNFYLQFANAASQYFTWSDGQQNSLTSFAEGGTAAIFNYRASLTEIEKKSPFLNIGIAPMPQVDSSGTPVNYAKYYGLAASRQSKVSGWAWDFIIYATANMAAAENYQALAGRPPSLRSSIAGKQSDPELGVFAKQALTARSWRQIDDQKITGIFNRAIKSVLTGQTDSGAALLQAQSQINQLIK